MLLILWFCYALNLSGQEGILPLNNEIQWRIEQSAGGNIDLPSDMKPYSFWTVQKFAAIDANDTKHMAALPIKRSSGSYIRVVPKLSLLGYREQSSANSFGGEALGGAGIGFGIKNRLYASLDGIWGWSKPYSYLGGITDSLGALPAWGHAAYNSNGNDPVGIGQVSGVIAYKPSEHFALFAGRGRHFIGEGYRSVFLSDMAPNYNYGRIDVNVWRLNYMVLYAQFDQTADYPRANFPTFNKYSTMHYLSLKVTEFWKVGAFEAVVWESEDSVIQRGFDVNYLNPIIFFRPVEYGMGSTDNSMLGFSSTLQPAPGLTLYGQLLLDELVLREWLAPIERRLTGDSTLKTGWWANKQSYQLGVKYHEPFSISKSSWISEVNIVRPFTYGHSNPSQSFTHFNTPLAHPLGANFIEWVQVFNWQPGKLNFTLTATYARKGYTNQIAMMGEDLLISSAERDQNNREHGNFLLQGRREDVANMRLNMAYLLIPSWNLCLTSNIHFRYLRTEGGEAQQFFFGLGVRTALWNDQHNL